MKTLTLMLIEHTLWYEGPILSHVRDYAGQNYFAAYYDITLHDKLMLWKISPETLAAYTEGYKSLRETMQEADHVMFFTDLKRTHSCRFDEVPVDLQPSTESFSEAYFKRQEEMA